jgi:hypothetical protein
VIDFLAGSSNYKVHARADVGDLLCGAISKSSRGTWVPVVTDDASKVTCARCLRMLRMVASMTKRESAMRSPDRKDKLS